METKNTLSRVYPVLFIICPHILMLLLISASRFSWPEAAAAACAGIASGIFSEILIIRKKISLGTYIPKLFAATIIGILLWVAGYLFKDNIAETIFGWGWWLKTSGIMLDLALLFVPALISSAFLAIRTRRPASSVITLIIIDPILQLALLWYAFDTVLSALPT